MTISVSSIWEVRGNGNDTNGGGFRTASVGITAKTDLVVNASNNLIVSSTTYGFTSADVGRWLNISAGTGWTLGCYNIIAVSGGNATLDRSPAPVSTGSGSFTIFYGLDYSQQNAKNTSGSNISTTDVVANGTTTITSATANFNADCIGNIIYLTGGTGSLTAGRYEIRTYTNSTTVTVDTAIATGTGITMNIGGALASLTEVLSTRGAIGSNKIWWKNDVGLSASTSITSSIAGAYPPTSIIGYTSTRGDGGRPTLTSSVTSGNALSISGSGNWLLQNFIINCNNSSGLTGLNMTGAGWVNNVTVQNYDAIGINGNNANLLIYGCEATGGTTNATAGIESANGGTLIIGNYVHDGNGSGIVGTLSGVILGNIVANQAGATADGILSSGGTIQPILNNTVYNCGRNGINMSSTSNLYGMMVLNNVLVNNAGYGVSTGATAVFSLPFWDGNAYYNNTLGTRHNMNNITSNPNVVSGIYTAVNDLVLTGNPLNNPGSGDFSLNSISGAGAACQNSGLPRSFPGAPAITAFPDMGAVQRNNSNMVTVYANYAF